MVKLKFKVLDALTYDEKELDRFIVEIPERIEELFIEKGDRIVFSRNDKFGIQAKIELINASEDRVKAFNELQLKEPDCCCKLLEIVIGDEVEMQYIR